MTRQTIEEVYQKLLSHVGIEYNIPISENKGGVGLFLEDLLDIPHSPTPLDCLDGEVKSVPIKKLKSGKLVYKETIAVTMLCPDELKIHDFKSSKCQQKLNRVLIVPYYREGDAIKFLTPKIITPTEYPELYVTIESDYNEIQQKYIETGELRSETGTVLQNRTKGKGNGSTSRAFYLRKAFMDECIPFAFDLRDSLRCAKEISPANPRTPTTSCPALFTNS